MASSRGSNPDEPTRPEDSDSAIGRLAVSLGYLSESRLREALRELDDCSDTGSEAQLGQILLRRGWLTGAQFSALLRSASRSRTGSSVPSSSSLPAPLPRSIGKYQVVRLLGKGGMATVYEGLDPDLRRRVALKVLRSGEGDAIERVERLRREAMAAARLRHPHIVAVHEVGTSTQADGTESHFIAMDYVDGPTLSDRMGDLSLAQGLAILVRIARAVEHAHRAGIVHRDLKPQNVILEARPDGSWQPLLTDFGLAWCDDGDNLTRTGASIGTPYYMAPEQVRGERRKMGTWTDVWALGVILFEMLYRRKPFSGRSALQVYDLVLHKDPVPPARARRVVPRALERICFQALAKDPACRYPSATELAEDLERHLAGERVRARGRGLERYATRRGALAGAAVLASGLALAIGLALVSGGDPEPTPVRPPAAEAPPDPEVPATDDARPEDRRRLAETLREALAHLQRVEATPGLSAATRDEILAEAERLLSTALELDDASTEALLARARVRQLRGESAGALADAGRAIAAAPDSADGYLVRAQLDLERYRLLRPFPQLQATVSSLQFLPLPEETPAEAAIRELVVQDLEAALERLSGERTRWKARLAAGLLAFHRERYPEAIAELEPASIEGSLFHETHHSLGAAYLLAERDEDAIRTLSKGLDLAPECFECRVRRGLARVFAVHRRLGDGTAGDEALRLAAEDFTEASEGRAADPTLFGYRAIARHLRGRFVQVGRSSRDRLEIYREAIADHEAALALRPDDPVILMALGWAYHDASGPYGDLGWQREEYLRRAVDHYASAAAATPHDYLIHVVLGNARTDHASCLEGDAAIEGKRRAIDAYARALEIAPGDAYTLTTRGLARAWIAAKLQDPGEYERAHADLSEAIRVSNGTFEWAVNECSRICSEWAFLLLARGSDPEPVWSRAVAELERRVAAAPAALEIESLARLHQVRGASAAVPAERRRLLERARDWWRCLLDLAPDRRASIEAELEAIRRALE